MCDTLGAVTVRARNVTTVSVILRQVSVGNVCSDVTHLDCSLRLQMSAHVTLSVPVRHFVVKRFYKNVCIAVCKVRLCKVK
jgi:hypothetical protein